MMLRAERPVFYTGGGVINAGPEASQHLRELAELTGFPVTSTLMGLGAFPGVRSAVARHARHARHLRSQHGDARLRPDDQHRRALRRPHHRPHRCVLAERAARSTSTSTRQSINKNVAIDLPIVGDCGHVLRGDGPHLAQPRPTQPRSRGAGAVVEADRGLARAQVASASRNSDSIIKPQHAIQRLYEATKGRDVYVTTEVGQHQMWAAQHFPLRAAQPLDDLGRARHDGLWPARRDRRRRSRIPTRWSSTSPAKPASR